MGFRFKWVLVALLVFVAGQPERAAGELPKIRVGLLQDRESVSFSGPAGITVQALHGDRVIAWAPPGQVWTAGRESRHVRLSDEAGSQSWALDRGLRLLPPEGGVVALHGVGGHWDEVTDREYRGTLEVRRDRVGGLTVVNVVGIETYLRGVVPSEMPATYPLAALKAQAVAARGQALIKAGRHRSEGFDLCAGQHCQVYGGATSEAASTDRAVAETRGEVLEYDGRLADTLYSSNCGGHTANNEDYWPDQKPVPYLRGRPDFDPERVALEFPLSQEDLDLYLKYAPPVNCNQPRYASSSKIRWWSVMPRKELAKTICQTVGDFGELLDLRVTERADCGMARELTVIGSRRLYKVRGPAEIRRVLGGLNSATFAVSAVRERDDLPAAFVIWGAGWGHQVGMCQVGAAGLADAGWDYREILSKYYLRCRIARRY